MKTKKVHILYEHSCGDVPHGCSEIRLLRPLTHPSIASWADVTSGTNLPDFPVDTVIVERLWKPDIAKETAQDLVCLIKGQGAKFIYSIDDNLLDLGLETDLASPLTAEQKDIIRIFATKADGILVSTPELKKRMAVLNSNIKVVANALDEQLFSQSSPSSPSQHLNNRLVIGYMGTFSHLPDLMMILQPLREVLYERKDQVELQLLGIAAESFVMELFTGLPFKIIPVDKTIVQYHNFVSWFQKNICWDIGIAPLAKSSFSLCKSDIKFLDYAAAGIPAIFSALPGSQLYRTLIADETALIANSLAEWKKKLYQFIDDPSLRMVVSANAKKYVLENRLLKQRATDWVEAIKAF